MGDRVKFAPEWSIDVVSGISRFGVRTIENPQPRGWAWRGMDNRFYWRTAHISKRERGVSKTMDGARRAAVAAARRMLADGAL